MGIQKRSRDSSKKEKNQDRILKVFVKILQKKEDQLQSLVMSRKILEHRIKTQHKNHEEQLSLLKNEIKTLEMIRMVEIANFNLLLGMKKRDDSICKSKLEHTQDELDDFKAWFELLTRNTNKETCNSGDADDCKSLEFKIRKLKLNFENLAFGKRSDVSAWSQFKDMESGFTDKLRRKDEEIKKLKSSNNEKDKIIARLMAEMEDNGSKKKAGLLKPLRRSPRLNNDV
ncbi:unnamed protein product [Arabis nemorensis]|uniref:Uncharacterized protein n=1 Tax=Arabis nemorensis TaxID=586526 RepID=A0A565B148_9BRAS|nr:unnamed protein product [Arabis nemorensis]